MGIFDVLFGPPNIEKLKARWFRGQVGGLIKALRHTRADIRAEAARALQRVADSDAIVQLSPQGGTSLWAAINLSANIDARAIGPLLSALADPQATVRLEAAKALGQFRDSRVPEVLLGCLASDLQADAIRALRRMGYWPTDRPFPSAAASTDGRLLVGLAAHGDSWARANVAKLIAADVATIREAIAKSRDQVTRGLAEHLEDADDRVRAAAARALELVGPQGTDAATARNQAQEPSGGVHANPRCSACGKALSGGESVLRQGVDVALTSPGRTLEAVEPDYGLFDGVVCFKCRMIFCLDCVGGNREQCPRCIGETQPAYLKHIRQIINPT